VSLRDALLKQARTKKRPAVKRAGKSGDYRWRDLGGIHCVHDHSQREQHHVNA